MIQTIPNKLLSAAHKVKANRNSNLKKLSKPRKTSSKVLILIVFRSTAQSLKRSSVTGK